FGEVFARAAGIESIAGLVVFETNSGITEAVTLHSQGQLRLEDFHLGMPEAGLDLVDEQIVLDWDVRTDLPSAAATLDHVTLAMAPGTIDLRGLLSPEVVDLAIEGAIDFDALAARGFVPEGITLAGNAQVNLDV